MRLSINIDLRNKQYVIGTLFFRNIASYSSIILYLKSLRCNKQEHFYGINLTNAKLYSSNQTQTTFNKRYSKTRYLAGKMYILKDLTRGVYVRITAIGSVIKTFSLFYSLGRPSQSLLLGFRLDSKSFSNSILYVMDNNTCPRAHCETHVCIDDLFITATHCEEYCS